MRPEKTGDGRQGTGKRQDKDEGPGTGNGCGLQMGGLDAPQKGTGAK